MKSVFLCITMSCVIGMAIEGEGAPSNAPPLPKGAFCTGYDSSPLCDEGLICEDENKPGVNVNSCFPDTCKCRTGNGTNNDGNTEEHVTAVCTTENPEDANNKGNTCVFPFKYKGKTYEKCTKVESDNGKSWCAFDIRPGTEVPQDGKHWGDCNEDCPGADFECDEAMLFNIRGSCVPASQQNIRIARPYAHEFRSGLNDTKPVRKCSQEPPYVHQRIKGGKCYCLAPRKGVEKQEGEGCTKKPVQEDAFIFDAANLPGVDGAPPPPPPEDDPAISKGWCYLGGVKDPRYFEPKEHCYDDLQWSETEQKFWSTNACHDVPVGGVPA